MNVYLDNAATTALDLEVFETMKPFFLEELGNPSSVHAHGRRMRGVIEIARKNIAKILHCTPGEILFTSGGTEANNTIIMGAVITYGIKHVISSAIEHHSVGHTLAMLHNREDIQLHTVQLDEKGTVDYVHLEELLDTYPHAMVSLMHANNEIGNLLDIKQVADLCNRYGSYFHSDTVQSVAHYPYNLDSLQAHGLTASAHKFHGPYGIGFMYINKNKKINPFIYGGAQERDMRAGTEHVPGIVGMAKAMEIAYCDMKKHEKHVKDIKKYMIRKLIKSLPQVIFNGHSNDVENSLYTVLNVGLPVSKDGSMLLFNLDLEGISASGGSACSSGSITKSHVINVVCPSNQWEAIRFSFSKYTKYEEIDYTVEKLTQLCYQKDTFKNPNH